MEKFILAKCEALKQRTTSITSDDALLQFFATKWDEWRKVFQMIAHILQYLNRVYVQKINKTSKPNSKTGMIIDIQSMCYMAWRDKIMMPHRDHLCQAILSLIEQERNGQEVCWKLIKDSSDCFVCMGNKSQNTDPQQQENLSVYKTSLEQPFLQATEVYYTAEASRFMAQEGVSVFLKQFSKRIAEERERVSRYLHHSSISALHSKLAAAWVTRHKSSIESSFCEMLKLDSTEDLRNTYDAMSLLEGDGHSVLHSHFRNHIQTVGKEKLQEQVNEAAQNPKVFVDLVLGVYRKYSTMISELFRSESNPSGDKAYSEALDMAFREFMNSNAVIDLLAGEPSASSAAKLAESKSEKVPTILARFCDLFLKKGTEGITDDGQMEKMQNDVISLFRYLPDKDIFMQVYTKLLSKRLIQGISVSEDSEISLINKLKESQGPEYCRKLQTMVTDMSSSNEMNRHFEDHCVQHNFDLPFSVSVHVLTGNAWPMGQSEPTSFRPPMELQQIMKSFGEFYLGKYKGRVVSYRHSIGRADMLMRFEKSRPLTLTVNTFQLSLLLQFNDNATINLKQLISSVDLPRDALDSALMPLVKLKVLTASEENFTDATEFTVSNALKTFKKPKLNCVIQVSPSPSASDGAKLMVEENANSEELRQDRLEKLKAAIVRIMKARKEQSHNELVTDALNQVRRWFAPQVALVKQAIEQLIEKDYLKRKEGDHTKYQYVA
eukprot:TRINITY_DN2351_c0_g1_i3.p1 TRINITY_DN2351_c0_g1~~TRINITY_DN2351_c0_g1_i3.p1  ORF type:complete len:721 (-),score=161.63 TRINITY_DN2351_c0_g1_i3:53-2215(-)